MFDVKKKRQLCLFVLLLLLVLSGCNSISKSQYEQTISDLYSQSGLDGSVKVEYVKGQGYLYTTPYTRVAFDYTEVVDGRSVTVNNTMFFEHKTDYFDGDTAAIGAEDLTEFNIYSGVIQSFAFQEESIALAKMVERELTKQIDIEDFVLKEVAPHLETYPSADFSEELGSFTDNFASYKEEVAKNKKEDKPFSGYYDIDVEKHMERGIIVMEISYENHAEDISTDSINELKANIYNQLSTLDVSNFCDGIYQLSFHTVTEKVSVGDWGSYTFHVKDKKLSRVYKER